MLFHTVRRRRMPRGDESMQDHRQPTDALAWTTYVGVLTAVVASAILVGSGLHVGVGPWALLFFGAGIIAALISLAVLPSLRKR